MKKYLSILLAAVLCAGAFSACNKKETVTLYSTSEDFRNEAARKMQIGRASCRERVLSHV